VVTVYTLADERGLVAVGATGHDGRRKSRGLTAAAGWPAPPSRRSTGRASAR
jgi:hypothetical protein